MSPRCLLACLAAGLCVAAAVPRHASASFGCGLVSQPQAIVFGEGAADQARYLRASGALRAVMLFVDFPDAPASESPAALYGQLVPDARSWLAAVSDGRATLAVDPVERWYRLGRPSAAYGLARGALTFAEQREYVAEAVGAADADVDFSRYQLVYVVASRGAAIGYSPAFVATTEALGIRADGTTLRYGITFGSDIRSAAGWGASILAHETGHAFGLPDLYEDGGASYWEAFRSVGGWDPMSWLRPRAGLLAWERWKLGWLDDAQVVCAGAGTTVATLVPAAAAGGRKAVVAPLGAGRAYVLEARRRAGQDARLCDQGVLLYRVDTTVDSGRAPIRVVPAHPDPADVRKLGSCGPLWSAPFDLGRGEVSTFHDAAAGFSLELLGRTPGGGYTVRVTTTGA